MSKNVERKQLDNDFENHLKEVEILIKQIRVYNGKASRNADSITIKNCDICYIKSAKSYLEDILKPRKDKLNDIL